MKKLFVFVLAIIMLLTCSVPALAASKNFIVSPSTKGGPELIEYHNSSPDCTAILDIVPYSEREKYGETTKEIMEEACDTIRNADVLTDIVPGLDALAKEKKVAVGNLAVSDIYDHYFEGCNKHDKHGLTTVVVSPELIQNFVALMYYYNGTWVLVEDVKVSGNTLTYDVLDNCPYAIIVKRADTPKTGDEGLNPIWIILLAVSAAGLIIIAVTYKKSKKDDDK